LCHDKVHCSTRELRDELLPLTSDIPFSLSTRKIPYKLIKLLHWLTMLYRVILSGLLHVVFILEYYWEKTQRSKPLSGTLRSI
ncbi:hypothetical protein, partial [Staphylococcus aureus]